MAGTVLCGRLQLEAGGESGEPPAEPRFIETGIRGQGLGGGGAQQSGVKFGAVTGKFA